MHMKKNISKIYLGPPPKNNGPFVFVLYLLVYKKLRKKCCLLDLPFFFFNQQPHTPHQKRYINIYIYIRYSIDRLIELCDSLLYRLYIDIYYIII